jgi:hypothetical protein
MGTIPALVVKWCVMQVLSMYDQMPILINNTVNTIIIKNYLEHYT